MRTSKRNPLFRCDFFRFYGDFHDLPNSELNDEEYGEYVFALNEYCIYGNEPTGFKNPKAEQAWNFFHHILIKGAAKQRDCKPDGVHGDYYCFYADMHEVVGSYRDNPSLYGFLMRSLNDYSLYGKEPGREMNEEESITYSVLRRWFTMGGRKYGK